MDKDEFKTYVEKTLLKHRLPVADISTADRCSPELQQGPFHALHRNSRLHVPDLMVLGLPCELKGPKELEEVGHHSRIHLLAHLLATVGGQLLSYSDVYRSTSGSYQGVLIVPYRIRFDKEVELEQCIRTLASPELQPAWAVMNLNKVIFSAARFPCKGDNLWLIDDTPGIIATIIDFKLAT